VDLSNYKEIASYVRGHCKNMSEEDKEDLVQEVYARLLASKLSYVNKNVLHKLVWQLKIDMHRKAERRPVLIYNDELAEYVADKQASQKHEASEK